jgi:hypothetical protein
MSATRARAAHLRRQVHRRALALGAATLCVLSLVTVQAQAAPSTFLELDGNLVSNATGAYDWANAGALSVSSGLYSRAGSGGVFDGGRFNGNTTPPTAPTRTGTDAAIADAAFKVDPLSVDSTACGAGDPTVYTGAGSETNGSLLSSDTFSTGSTPNKDDLSNVYALAHLSGSTNEVFFGAERVINNGDSHIDFEFLQSTVTIPNACSGSFSGNRTQGDFLLAVDFTSGGTLGGVQLYKWLCDAGSGGLTNHTKDGQVCNPPANGKSVPHYQSTGTTAVQIKVNDTAAAIGCGGWVCRNPDGSPTLTLAQNELMEGGIDLAQLGFTGCVSTFLPHTRSSQSFTATLKDFEVIPFNTCRRPSVTTNIHNAAHTDVTGTNQAVGTVLHDTATLHDNTADAGGTVSYRLYTAADCGGTATNLTPTNNTVVNGVAPDSSTFTFNNVGTYYFEATYSGDARNLVPAGGARSGCNAEPVTIIPNTPSVTTNIRNAAGTDVTSTTQPVGTVLHDTATISGATAAAGGSISYKLFSDNACTTANLVADLTPNSSATADDVVNGVAPDSKTFTFTNAGSYWFYAVYSGDSNNTGPVNSGCASEPITISPNATTTTTAIRNAANADVTNTTQPIGTVLHDTATISGATATAGGTITYTLYTGLNCTGTATDLTPVTNTVVSGAAPDSQTFTFNNAGTFYFKATYSGDSNNVGSNSGCNAEPITISPNGPVPHSTPVVQIKDTFRVTGLTSDATGNVLIGVYSDSSCTTRIGGSSDESFAASVLRDGSTHETTFFGAPAGSYYFKISYAGDNNNTGFSDCSESATVSITSKA